jgi:hypothetical protein
MGWNKLNIYRFRFSSNDKYLQRTIVDLDDFQKSIKCVWKYCKLFFEFHIQESKIVILHITVILKDSMSWSANKKFPYLPHHTNKQLFPTRKSILLIILVSMYLHILIYITCTIPKRFRISLLKLFPLLSTVLLYKITLLQMFLLILW